MIPGVSISSDFRSGFCGETEEEHQDTLTLIERVKFDQAYMYAYSLREKTHASHNYQDDVPEETKQRRLREVIDTFRKNIQEKNDREVLNTIQLVLIDGIASKSTPERPRLSGRTDSNKRVVFDSVTVPDMSKADWFLQIPPSSFASALKNSQSVDLVQPVQGDYVLVKVLAARGHTLRGDALGLSSLANFAAQKKLLE